MKYRLSFVGLIAAALPSLAMATPVVGIDALKEWNLIVLGDLTSSSEVEGRTFVGGNLSGNSSNYQIRTPAPSSYAVPGLTVVGDVLGGTKNLDNGSGALVGGSVQGGFNRNGGVLTVKVGGTLSNTNINQNIVQSGLSASDPGFVAGLNQQKTLLASSMTDLSNSYAGLTATSSVSIAGNRATFNAVANANGVAVFNLNAADLSRFGEIAFNRNGADTVIVNVTGRDQSGADRRLEGIGPRAQGSRHDGQLYRGLGGVRQPDPEWGIPSRHLYRRLCTDFAASACHTGRQQRRLANARARACHDGVDGGGIGVAGSGAAAARHCLMG